MRQRILSGDRVGWLEEVTKGIYLVYSGTGDNGAAGSVVSTRNGSGSAYSWSTTRGRGGVAPTLDAAIARVLSAARR